MMSAVPSINILSSFQQGMCSSHHQSNLQNQETSSIMKKKGIIMKKERNVMIVKTTQNEFGVFGKRKDSNVTQ